MPKRVKPLQVYKLLPRTNCGECGESSCMAFAAKLVEREVELERCKPLFRDPKYRRNLEELMRLLRPPVKAVKIGVPPRQVVIGGKDVVYRHELTWRNQTALAIDVHDLMTPEEVERRVKFAEEFKYERMGRFLKMDMVAIRCASGEDVKFLDTVKKVSSMTDMPLVLCCLEPSVMEAALKEVGTRKPLIYAATLKNWKDMAELALKYGCPLVVSAPRDLSALKSLSASIRKYYELDDLVLDPGTLPDDVGIAETLTMFTALRYSAIEVGDEDLGYPLLAVPATAWLAPEPEEELTEFREALIACLLMARYADIMILHTADSWPLIAVLSLRDCLYTDPRVPPSVKPGLYKIGEPDEWSPLFVTCNYALTVSLVKGDIEKSKVPSWLLIIDTEGTSVESAVAGRKFTAEKIADAVKEHKLDQVVKHKTIVIPGRAAKIAGELEDLLPGWRVMVGTRESSDIPKFIRKVWMREVLGKEET